MIAKTEKGISDFLRELICTLVAIIEEKDGFMKGHAERVAGNCVSFCEKKGLLKQDELEGIYFAGLLHDLGMVYLPLELVQKPDELTEDERAMIQRHPEVSVKILSNVNILGDILPTIRHHHENFDGSGYPDGLKGDNIPLGARVICLADSYDAMTSTRPQRPALSMEKALGEISNNSGTLFDDTLVNDFVEFIESTGGGSKVIKIKEDKAEAEKRMVQDLLEQIVKKFNDGKIDPPVLPQVVQEVEKVINDQTSTHSDLAEAIQKDAVISLRMVSVANSPLYRGVKQIVTVGEAIPRLGLKQTENLVSAIAHKGLYDTKSAQFRVLMEKLWLHSLACAYAARAIAEKLALGDVEAFFMMGLTHDIGKSLLLKLLIETLTKNRQVKTSDAMKAVHQIHCGFGGKVLQRWKFREEFIEIAKLHEGPEFSSDAGKGVLVVNLANNLTRNIQYSLFEDEVALADLESATLLGIDADTLNTIGEHVKEVMKKSAQLF